jgi:hypothetical protein
MLQFSARRGPTRELLEVPSVSYPGTPAAAKILQRFDAFPTSVSETTPMVITSAHISPIIALVAGLLILVMPRLLNFIVAIYLICIGLTGLGLLKWLHF